MKIQTPQWLARWWQQQCLQALDYRFYVLDLGSLPSPRQRSRHRAGALHRRKLGWLRLEAAITLFEARVARYRADSESQVSEVILRAHYWEQGEWKSDMIRSEKIRS